MSQSGQYTLTSTALYVQTLTGDAGGAVGPAAGNINVLGGAGITVNGNPGTNTLTIVASGAGFTWTEVTGTSQALAVDNGYIVNNAALVTLTLPAAGAIGDSIQIIGKGAGGWKVAQNAGQTIHYSSLSSTTGVGGSLDSTHQRDCIELVCVTANTDWQVVDGVGNVTVT
jgi:hypothetical protein